MAELVPDEFKQYLSKDVDIVEINYPVLQYPEKVKSLKLDREQRIRKKMIGIKGQYLIFDDGSVLNIRSHAGYRVSIESLGDAISPTQASLF
jgi:hypothetical protein